VDKAITQNNAIKNIAALYPGVSGGENIIATNNPMVIVKLSRDKKTVTVIREPFIKVRGATKLP
jgi:hypothetical protein